MVKEVFEQFTVGGTALRLSKFDAVDLVLAIFWSRFLIISFSDQDMILVPIVMFVFALKLFKLGCRYSHEIVNREALYCRRNCFEIVKIWHSRLGSSNFLDHFVFLFMTWLQAKEYSSSESSRSHQLEGLVCHFQNS